ncbi:MAG TPA: hypothetical protein VKB56_12370 [Terriglobales bacterium]|nr:hypothetical protein [Terriglobales bacterium]
MRSENRSLSFTLVFSLLVAGFSAHAQTLNTTTTLAAETGNNTSAANSLAALTNGNIGASNISKVPLYSLLYPGSNTLLWAHFMAWFGSAGHINVGYTSSDPAQVHNQVTDAMSRGLNAFVEDWYGPSKTVENDTALALKSEAESRGGQFSFGIAYDGGALSACASTTGCDLTQQAIKDLTYAYNTFETSPAYVRLNGRPVVMFFNPDRYATLNWPLITSSVAGNPLFIFENSNGFTHASSSGSFAWVLIDTSNANNWEQSYLDSFFTTAQSYPAEYGWAATYKGFNDSLASWHPAAGPRIMNQNCGQTWLNTFNEANKYWSAGKQLEALQLVTWNDYEEGSELESGIDNCVKIGVTVNGTSLSWSLTSGVESTIDHYTVFISTDGQNLMSLGNVPAGIHTFDLSGANLTAGNYSLFVKGVGRPLLTNKMSAAVLYNLTSSSSSGSGSTGSNGSSGSTGSVSGTSGGTSASPDIALALNPASVTVAQGQAASVGLSVTPESGFQGAVSFTCSNLPANAQCSFAPASLNLSGSAATATISISTAAPTVGALRSNPDIPLFRWFDFSSSAFGLAGLVLTGRKRRETVLATTAACVLTLAALAACGGTGQNSSSVMPPTTTGQSASMTPRGNYQIAVTATSGSISHATSVSLVVQ